jgi:hypothetical protein
LHQQQQQPQQLLEPQNLPDPNNLYNGMSTNEFLNAGWQVGMRMGFAVLRIIRGGVPRIVVYTNVLSILVGNDSEVITMIA